MKLTLKNFQSHKHSEIQISEGITALLGDNDVGKTAVVRALRWLFWNRPSGDAFRSHWGGPTEVRLDTDRGWIARYRDAKSNLYLVNGTELRAIGLQVPQEVSDFFRVDEINFQFQSDPPFLLGMSPGERANYLQRITKMLTISVAEDILRRRIKSMSAELANLDSEIQRIRAQRTRYAGLDDVKHEIDSLRDTELTLEEKKRSLDSLLRKIEEFKFIEAELKTLKIYQGLSADILQVEEYISRREKLDSDYNKIRKAITEYQRLNSELKKAKIILDDLKDRWNRIAPEVCPLCGQPFPSRS